MRRIDRILVPQVPCPSHASAAKLRADDKGNEKEIPINDLIDIGVFSGKGKTEKNLYLEKRRITQQETTIEVVVDQQPTRAGIDPYNKVMDRVSEDCGSPLLREF